MATLRRAASNSLNEIEYKGFRHCEGQIQPSWKSHGNWLPINLSTGQKIRQDKQDEQDYFIFHHGKS